MLGAFRKTHRDRPHHDNILGLTLRTPLVPSASPLSQEIASIRRLEDAGASAVVLYSLFEEQLRQRHSLDSHHHLAASTIIVAEALTFFPAQASEFTPRAGGLPRAYPQSQGSGRHSRSSPA